MCSPARGRIRSLPIHPPTYATTRPPTVTAEIVEFCRYLAPSSEEQAQRQAAIDRIGEAVRAIWPSADVQVFGSFATGAPVHQCSMSLVAAASLAGAQQQQQLQHCTGQSSGAGLLAALLRTA
jgi:DNA polymerase sigma